MKHISELSSILSRSLPRNVSHATLFAQLMVAFCAVRTVNLKQVVNAIQSHATLDIVSYSVSLHLQTSVLMVSLGLLFAYSLMIRLVLV